ncbi:TPA: membrane integrity-associated transporter subunit PqiC [Campylobacter jejuni]|nr:membrane integrity-associated transporter subunit PqiC [Campylobacter jejuni]HDZ4936731.1 membrane integrity-associated transporter subunit PqiC [Campylobacter jejuni]HDZ4940383.1 membrane integrity-associated transporter subunit PqiC [Campylobacter jejuni]HDZ4944176.1 membrane integrity-associated transporter subunit PqiC [Campylobacter jejuni]HDZ4945843.1 membrane integrity-associated transporter subunit PqiC [Campylobacter jejuni]
MLKQLFYILTFIFILYGCSLRHENINKNENIILKDEGIHPNIFLKKTDKILKIRNTNAPLYLNSRAIIYIDNGFSNKYAHYFWGDLPSNLYSSLILSKFEQSNIFTTLLSSTSSLNANYVLESRINSFEQILNGDENYAQISISVNFINLENNQIIAHKIFNIKENIEKKDIRSTYNAFQKALNKIGNEIIFWVNSNLS